MRNKCKDHIRQLARKKRNQVGFTLIEVLLVLIILVVLGSLATTVFTGTQDKANIQAAEAQIGLLGNPIDLYRFHMNRYPNKLEDLWEEPTGGQAHARRCRKV